MAERRRKGTGPGVGRAFTAGWESEHVTTHRHVQLPHGLLQVQGDVPQAYKHILVREWAPEPMNSPALGFISARLASIDIYIYMCIFVNVTNLQSVPCKVSMCLTTLSGFRCHLTWVPRLTSTRCLSMLLLCGAGSADIDYIDASTAAWGRKEEGFQATV